MPPGRHNHPQLRVRNNVYSHCSYDQHLYLPVLADAPPFDTIAMVRWSGCRCNSKSYFCQQLVQVLTGWVFRLWAIDSRVLGLLSLIPQPLALGGPLVLIDFQFHNKGTALGL